MSNIYIEKRNNGAAVVEYTGSSKQLIAAFAINEDGQYIRTLTNHKGFPHMAFSSLEDIRIYYGIPLRATVYYKAVEEKINGEYVEVPKCYEIEYETSYNRPNMVKQYPIIVSPDGEWLVSDKLLREIATLRNNKCEVTIMY